MRKHLYHEERLPSKVTWQVRGQLAPIDNF